MALALYIAHQTPKRSKSNPPCFFAPMPSSVRVRPKSCGATIGIALPDDLVPEVNRCALLWGRHEHLPTKAPPPLLPASLTGQKLPRENDMIITIENAIDESEPILYRGQPLAVAVNFQNTFLDIERALKSRIPCRFCIVSPAHVSKSDRIMIACAVQGTRVCKIVRCYDEDNEMSFWV